MIQGLQDETYVVLMNDAGEMREDLQLPQVLFNSQGDEAVSRQIEEFVGMLDGGDDIEIYCTILAAVGSEKIVDVRKKAL